jgi:hypothetical protein
MFLKSGNPGYQTNSPLLVAENDDWTGGKDCSCLKIDAKAATPLATPDPSDSGDATPTPADPPVTPDPPTPPVRRRLLEFTDETAAFPAKCQLPENAEADAKPFCYVGSTCPDSTAVTNGGG